MPEGYGTHADYMKWVAQKADERVLEIEKSLRDAFAPFIETRSVEVVVFSNISAMDLAEAMVRYPSVLKPLIAACNIAARAIERDINIKNINTYEPKLTRDQALVVAGYIKPFLPPYLEIPTLSGIDRISFIDKEIRKEKGQWERKILKSLNKFSANEFSKMKFSVEDEEFEIDAAVKLKGAIRVGIDIKRIEARRDIHKRCDEIVNKAAKLKAVNPGARFVAFIYYPFIDEHINIQNRLASENIDAVAFAAESEESVENAVRMLLSQLGVSR